MNVKSLLRDQYDFGAVWVGHLSFQKNGLQIYKKCKYRDWDRNLSSLGNKPLWKNIRDETEEGPSACEFLALVADQGQREALSLKSH